LDAAGPAPRCRPGSPPFRGCGPVTCAPHSMSWSRDTAGGLRRGAARQAAFVASCIPRVGGRSVTTWRIIPVVGPRGDTALAWGPSRPQPAGATLGRRPALIRGYRVFAVALAAGVPRVLAMVGYRPAVLFRKGTSGYLWRAPTVPERDQSQRLLLVPAGTAPLPLVRSRGGLAAPDGAGDRRHGVRRAEPPARHSAMPFICLAAALAFRKPHPEKLARTAPAGFPGHG